MRKVLDKRLILFLFLFVFCYCTAQAAEIVYTKGKVEVESAGGGWKQAQAGTQMNIGDSIRTARRSEADIQLEKGKNNYLKVDESTLLILSSTTSSEINKLNLANGKIYANIEELKAGMTFEVQTPSAIAGVRGTSWSIESDKNVDEAAAFNDDIYVKSYDQNNNLLSEVTVNEGFKTFIERFESASALVELSAQEMERWSDIKEEVTSRISEASGRVQESDAAEGPVEDSEGEIPVEEQIEVISELQKQQDTAEVKEQIEEKATEQKIEEVREPEPVCEDEEIIEYH